MVKICQGCHVLTLRRPSDPDLAGLQEIVDHLNALTTDSLPLPVALVHTIFNADDSMQMLQPAVGRLRIRSPRPEGPGARSVLKMPFSRSRAAGSGHRRRRGSAPGQRGCSKLPGRCPRRSEAGSFRVSAGNPEMLCQKIAPRLEWTAKIGQFFEWMMP